MAINPNQVKSTAEQERIRKELERLTGSINAGTNNSIGSTERAFVDQLRMQKDADLFAVNARRLDSGLKELSYDEYFGTTRPTQGEAPRVASGTIEQQGLSIQQPSTVISSTSGDSTQNIGGNGSVNGVNSTTGGNVYNEQAQLLINQLKQKIAEAKSQQEGIIKNAPQQFDPLRAQSELSKGQQLRSVLERNANLGDRGGIGRSAALQTQTAGENRLNAINLQQQNVIDTANQRIADLESQGRFEEANILAQQRIAELQDAMAQQRLMEQRAYQESLTASDRAYQESLTASDRTYQESQQANEQQRADFNNTIMANYNDLMAFANQLRSQNAPQWQIDAVLAARQQKIAEQGLDQMGRPLPVDTTPVLTSSSAALELWERLGVANEAISRALGVPVGQRYTDTSRSSGGSSVGSAPTNMTPKQVTTFVTETLRGTSGSQSADMLVRMNDAGYFDALTPAEIKTIMNKFGVDELMLEQAENRMTIPTQGVTLPTGRTTFPSGSGLSGMTSAIR